MRKFTFVMLVLVSISLWAQDVVTIHRVSHQEMAEVASKLGKMTFDNGQITLYSTEGDVLYTAPINDEVVIGINDDNASIGEETFPLESLLRNMDTDSMYRIYTIQGLSVSTVRGDAIGDLLNTLSRGTYILVGKNNIYKIRK